MKLIKWQTLRSLIFSRRNSGMILLEVMVSVVMLGVAVATLMRTFNICLFAVRKNESATQAFSLAESVLQTLEAEPPSKGKSEGTFDDDNFQNFSYTLESSEEKLRYRNQSTLTKADDLKPLKKIELKITYDDGRRPATTPVTVHMILSPIERFSYESKFYNELFLDES